MRDPPKEIQVECGLRAWANLAGQFRCPLSPMYTSVLTPSRVTWKHLCLTTGKTPIRRDWAISKEISQKHGIFLNIWTLYEFSPQDKNQSNSGSTKRTPSSSSSFLERSIKVCLFPTYLVRDKYHPWVSKRSSSLFILSIHLHTLFTILFFFLILISIKYFMSFRRNERQGERSISKNPPHL